MKVALVQAPFWGWKGPPLGIACLSAYLRERGYETVKFDVNAEAHAALAKDPCAGMWNQNQPVWGNYARIAEFYGLHKALFDGLVDRIVASDARVIGFSVLWSTEMVSRLIAQEIRRRDASRIVVFGGPQCALNDAVRLIDLAEVDYVITGEGEEALFELLEAIRTGRPTTRIASVISKSDRSSIPRPPLRNLDILPFPDFDGLDFSVYAQPVTLPSSTSRGCPNDCYYCNEKVFWSRFRPRSGERIFAEIVYQMRRHGVHRFEFTDSLVNGKVDHLEKFCDLVIDSGVDIQWMGQAVVRKEMTRELLAKIKRSGCFHLCFGMEHSSVEFMVGVGKALAKHADPDVLIRDCHEIGLPIGLNWMFGFPGETEEDFFRDLDFFTRNSGRLGKVSVNNSPGFCGFTPGTYGYEHPEALGITRSPDNISWKSLDAANTYVTRLMRYQRFCAHLDSLGVRYTSPAFANEDELIADYYFEIEKDYERALAHYRKDALRESRSQSSKDRSAVCVEMLNAAGKGETRYVLPSATDHNWRKGVALGWAAAFFVPGTAAARADMRVGSEVVFSEGTRRTIIEIRDTGDSLIVFLDGAPLDGDRVGHPGAVRVTMGGKAPENADAGMA